MGGRGVCVLSICACSGVGFACRVVSCRGLVAFESGGGFGGFRVVGRFVLELSEALLDLDQGFRYSGTDPELSHGWGGVWCSQSALYAVIQYHIPYHWTVALYAASQAHSCSLAWGHFTRLLDDRPCPASIQTSFIPPVAHFPYPPSSPPHRIHPPISIHRRPGISTPRPRFRPSPGKRRMCHEATAGLLGERLRR